MSNEVLFLSADDSKFVDDDDDSKFENHAQRKKIFREFSGVNKFVFVFIREFDRVSSVKVN